MSDLNSNTSGVSNPALSGRKSYESNDGHKHLYQHHLIVPNHNQTSHLQQKTETSHFSQVGNHAISRQLASHDNLINEGNVLSLHHAHYGQNLRQFQNQAVSIMPVVVVDATRQNSRMKNKGKGSNSRKATLPSHDHIENNIADFRGNIDKSVANSHHHNLNTNNNHTPPPSAQQSQINSERWGLMPIPPPNQDNHSMDTILSRRSPANQVTMENMKMMPFSFAPSLSESVPSEFENNKNKNFAQTYDFSIKPFKNKGGVDKQMQDAHTNVNTANQPMIANFNQMNISSSVQTPQSLLEYHPLSQQPQFQQPSYALNYMHETFVNQNTNNNSSAVDSNRTISHIYQNQLAPSQLNHSEVNSPPIEPFMESPHKETILSSEMIIDQDSQSFTDKSPFSFSSESQCEEDNNGGHSNVVRKLPDISMMHSNNSHSGTRMNNGLDSSKLSLSGVLQTKNFSKQPEIERSPSDIERDIKFQNWIHSTGFHVMLAQSAEKVEESQSGSERKRKPAKVSNASKSRKLKGDTQAEKKPKSKVKSKTKSSVATSGESNDLLQQRFPIPIVPKSKARKTRGKPNSMTQKFVAALARSNQQGFPISLAPKPKENKELEKKSKITAVVAVTDGLNQQYHNQQEHEQLRQQNVVKLLATKSEENELPEKTANAKSVVPASEEPDLLQHDLPQEHVTVPSDPELEKKTKTKSRRKKDIALTEESDQLLQDQVTRPTVTQAKQNKQPEKKTKVKAKQKPTSKAISSATVKSGHLPDGQQNVTKSSAADIPSKEQATRQNSTTTNITAMIPPELTTTIKFTYRKTLNSCNWARSAKDTLATLLKMITDETNPFLIFLFKKQKNIMEEFPQSALEYLKLNCGSTNVVAEKNHTATNGYHPRSRMSSPHSYMLKLIGERKLPRHPLLITSHEEHLSVASLQDDVVYSMFTANTDTGQLTKLLCPPPLSRDHCKCCYFSSIERWTASLIPTKPAVTSENCEVLWSRVLIQVPLMEEKIRNMCIVSQSRKKSGKDLQCAFVPLCQYINFTGNVNISKGDQNETNIEKSKMPIETEHKILTVSSKTSSDTVDEGKDLGNKVSSKVSKKHTVGENVKNLEVLAVPRSKSKNEPAIESIPSSSQQHLRQTIRKKPKDTNKRSKSLVLTKASKEYILFQMSARQNLLSKISRDYPNAPLGQIWMSSKTSVSEIEGGDSLLGRKWVWDEGYFADSEKSLVSKKRHMPECENPIKCRAYCNCGAHGDNGEKSEGGRTRRSAGNSVKLGHVLTELASGKLNPHTLVSCESYNLGPELDQYFLESDTKTDILAKLIKEKGGPTQVQPFCVRVSPDAAFLADLHAHLATCEVIGLLGGRWAPEEKCVYIQAAFPCKAADSGSTDVEMDPVSQVMARDSIAAHGLKVVGWYHSHPTFQPDPSVTDIENQGNYQRLFSGNDGVEGSIPFVGLIIGTWDGRNPSPRSVMRWFHVTPKETGNLMSIKNQSSMVNVNVDFSLSGGAAKERVLFPMKLEVTHRRFRSENMILNDYARRELTLSGTEYRLKRKLRRLDALRDEKLGEMEMWKNVKPSVNGKKKKDMKIRSPVPLCQVVSGDETYDLYTDSSTNTKRKKTKLLPSVEAQPDDKNIENIDEGSSNEDALDPWKAFVYDDIVAENSFESSRESDEKDNDLEESDSSTNLVLYENRKETDPNEDIGICLISELKEEESVSAITDNHNHRSERNRCAAAFPLPFSLEEFNKLNSDVHTDDEELARIIWRAVERDQGSVDDDESFENQDPSMSSWVSHHIRQAPPASSQAILQLLLQNHCFSLPDTNIEFEKTKPKYVDDDIALIHEIDAILSHYASSLKRIEISDMWSCSGVNYGSNGGTSGIAPGNNTKVRKGHKICVTLLRWARNMQLSGFRPNSSNSKDVQGSIVLQKVSGVSSDKLMSDEKAALFASTLDSREGAYNLPRWDHEKSEETSHFVREDGSVYSVNKSECEFSRQNTPIKFTAEVMRLLAARWREANGDSMDSKQRKKRGRPRRP